MLIGNRKKLFKDSFNSILNRAESYSLPWALFETILGNVLFELLSLSLRINQSSLAKS